MSLGHLAETILSEHLGTQTGLLIFPLTNSPAGSGPRPRRARRSTMFPRTGNCGSCSVGCPHQSASLPSRFPIAANELLGAKHALLARWQTALSPPLAIFTNEIGSASGARQRRGKLGHSRMDGIEGAHGYPPGGKEFPRETSKRHAARIDRDQGAAWLSV